MSQYVDSSVYLRILLGHPGALSLPNESETYTSALTRTEGRRTFYRLRGKDKFDDTELTRLLAALDALLDGVKIVACDQAILDRASDPMRTPLGTLDAIHLASALRSGCAQFYTHNIELAIAARTAGLEPVTK